MLNYLIQNDIPSTQHLARALLILLQIIKRAIPERLLRSIITREYPLPQRQDLLHGVHILLRLNLPHLLVRPSTHQLLFLESNPFRHVDSQTFVVVRVVVDDVELFVEEMDLVEEETNAALVLSVQILVLALQPFYVLAQNIVQLFDIFPDEYV